MHGYNARNLAESFRTVRKNTIQVAEDIPEDKYDFHPAEGCRSVADMLKHIAVSTSWPIYAHGQRLTALKHEMFFEAHAKQAEAEAKLKTKSDILKALHDNGEEFATD